MIRRCGLGSSNVTRELSIVFVRLNDRSWTSYPKNPLSHSPVPGPIAFPLSPIWVMHIGARTEKFEVNFIGVVDLGWTVYVVCQ